MTEIEPWIASYFEAHADLDGQPPTGLLEENYFERELLDSLGIVELIIGIEDEFGVRIESAHMQDPRFCTIRGLAQIVEEIRAG